MYIWSYCRCVRLILLGLDSLLLHKVLYLMKGDGTFYYY